MQISSFETKAVEIALLYTVNHLLTGHLSK